MALDSGTRLGPYEILAPLGAGGLGEVYRARDTRLDREVAVKVLPAGAVSIQALERSSARPKRLPISPDGRSIAFSSFDAQNQPAVTVCDLEACASRKTFLARGVIESHWTPDGRGIAYIDARTRSDLWGHRSLQRTAK